MYESRSLPTSLLPNSGPLSDLSTPCSSWTPADQREGLLIKLLFASVSLANSRIRHPFTGPSMLLCHECGSFAAAPSASIEHGQLCSTGQVIGIIEQLMALPYSDTCGAGGVASGLPSSADLDRVAEEQIAALATARLEGDRDFGEPWEIDPDDATALRDRRGLEVYSGMGTGLRLEDEARYAERIRVCVNACEGVELLDRLKPQSILRDGDAVGGLIPAGMSWVVGEQALTWVELPKAPAVTQPNSAVTDYEYPEAAK